MQAEDLLALVLALLRRLRVLGRLQLLDRVAFFLRGRFAADQLLQPQTGLGKKVLRSRSSSSRASSSNLDAEPSTRRGNRASPYPRSSEEPGRRSRSRPTRRQLDALLALYAVDCDPTLDRRIQLACELNMYAPTLSHTCSRAHSRL